MREGIREVLASDLSVGDWFYIIWGEYVDQTEHQVTERNGLSFKTADGFDITFAPSSVVGVSEARQA